jgi:fermentation-respiration switch protein FrsA (DUF1100 family)
LRALKIVAGILIILSLGSIALLFAAQRRLLYRRNHFYTSLAAAHANNALREFPVRTKDAIDLKGWYAPATAKPFTIVYFHGNADRLSTAAQIADPYINAGYGFLVAEYRGYSGLPGAPTETGLYEDGRAYLRGLISSGIKPEQIVVFGFSLGTGVAVQMATEFHVGGVMLAAPYLSIPKLAQVHYSFFPSFLVLDRYDNETKIKDTHAPLLIVNGTDDQVIPPAQGKQLYARANEPKEFHSVPDRGHSDLFDDLVPLSQDWMNRVRAPKRQGESSRQVRIGSSWARLRLIELKSWSN